MEVGNRHKIIVKDLPYLVNKARLIVKIAELVKEKVDGIADITDESDAGRNPHFHYVKKMPANIVLNQLYKYTQMQDVFSVNMLALAQDKKAGCTYYFQLKGSHFSLRGSQVDVVQEERVLIWKRRKRDPHFRTLRALDIIDEIIATIRSSSTTAVAKTRLIENFGLPKSSPAYRGYEVRTTDRFGKRKAAKRVCGIGGKNRLLQKGFSRYSYGSRNH